MVLFRFVIAIGFLVVSSSAMAATPFGLEMGTSLEQLDTADDGPKTMLKSVPKPHPDFETYAVWGSEESGLCVVIAISKAFQRDGYGLALQVEMKRLVNVLERKYGPATDHSMLRDGALFDDPEDWVMSLRQNERIHAYGFYEVQGSELGKNLESLVVDTIASSNDSAHIRMSYRFENAERCVSEFEARQDSAF